MKNSFCRICRGRFNLKYPPAAVDSDKKKPSSRTISLRIDESGEISENICWDCEDTLLGFHKSVGEDNTDEEEPVVVDDDEILYKNLEKAIRIHRLSKEVEIIKIDSSDSEHEECVTIPKEDIIRVESASTVVGITKTSVGDLVAVPLPKITASNMNIDQNLKKDIFIRAKVFESMRCPLCPYLSGIECEVVLHIRQTHPQYTGDHLRFDQHEEDTTLTRRIIFARLLTFFECKVCGKIHDRFWAHRKHLTTHDRKNLKNAFDDNITLNNNEVLISHGNINKVQTSKRALDYEDDFAGAKNPKVEERVLRRASKDNNCVELRQAVAVDATKSLQDALEKQQKHNAYKKSKSKGLLRKQQMLQARRDRRRQKRAAEKKAEEKKAELKIKLAPVIPKPTFKMPQQPAPRASSVVRQLISQPQYTCKLCSTTLFSFISWNMHMISIHSSAEFKNKSKDGAFPKNLCRKCDKRFESESNLRIHVRLSHRRKNRLVEINGNDNEEICRQTLTPKKESKELQQPSDDSFSLSNGVSKMLDESIPTLTSALLCQYCGVLFGDLFLMSTHESGHAAYEHVKRIFPINLQA